MTTPTLFDGSNEIIYSNTVGIYTDFQIRGLPEYPIWNLEFKFAKDLENTQTRSTTEKINENSIRITLFNFTNANGLMNGEPLTILEETDEVSRTKKTLLLSLIVKPFGGEDDTVFSLTTTFYRKHESID